MTYKRIEGAGFVWPRMTDGVISINRSQFEALFEGLDWATRCSRACQETGGGLILKAAIGAKRSEGVQRAHFTIFLKRGECLVFEKG